MLYAVLVIGCIKEPNLWPLWDVLFSYRDTAGKEQFRVVTPAYYRKAKVS